MPGDATRVILKSYLSPQEFFTFLPRDACRQTLPAVKQVSQNKKAQWTKEVFRNSPLVMALKNIGNIFLKKAFLSFYFYIWLYLDKISL